jgi:hypothetical protein
MLCFLIHVQGTSLQVRAELFGKVRHFLIHEWCFPRSKNDIRVQADLFQKPLSYDLIHEWFPEVLTPGKQPMSVGCSFQRKMLFDPWVGFPRVWLQVNGLRVWADLLGPSLWLFIYLLFCGHWTWNELNEDALISQSTVIVKFNYFILQLYIHSFVAEHEYLFSEEYVSNSAPEPPSI